MLKLSEVTFINQGGFFRYEEQEVEDLIEAGAINFMQIPFELEGDEHKGKYYIGLVGLDVNNKIVDIDGLNFLPPCPPFPCGKGKINFQEIMSKFRVRREHLPV